MMRTIVKGLCIGVGTTMIGCTPVPKEALSVPALEYMDKIRGQQAFQSPTPQMRLVASEQERGVGAPRVFLADGSAEGIAGGGPREVGDVVTNDPALQDAGVTVERFDNSRAQMRDYTGPLDLGDPGVTASLWKEGRGGNELFRDDRAWQPMDLITIVVSENDKGQREANTDTKSETTITAALRSFLGLEDFSEDANPSVDAESLIDATSSNEFKGKGKTDRKGSLTAKISAMVAEVLPTGILRIEGKKIVAVNGEEQVMVISGLVRPKDVSSVNEVDSAKIANMRIDYYGRGVVDDAQSPGWGTRLIRKVWPF